MAEIQQTKAKAAASPFKNTLRILRQDLETLVPMGDST